MTFNPVGWGPVAQIVFALWVVRNVVVGVIGNESTMLLASLIGGVLAPLIVIASVRYLYKVVSDMLSSGSKTPTS